MTDYSNKIVEKQQEKLFHISMDSTNKSVTIISHTQYVIDKKFDSYC